MVAKKVAYLSLVSDGANQLWEGFGDDAPENAAEDVATEIIEFYSGMRLDHTQLSEDIWETYLVLAGLG